MGCWWHYRAALERPISIGWLRCWALPLPPSAAGWGSSRDHLQRQPAPWRPGDRGPRIASRDGSRVTRRRRDHPACSATARRRSSRRARPGRRAFRAPRARRPRGRRPAPRAPAPQRAAAAARGLRAGARAPLRQPLQAQLRPRLGLLPARLVHDEAQPARCTSGSRRCPGTPGCTRCRPPEHAQGALELHVQPGARAGRGLRPAARLAAAERRLARRAGGRAADARLPRGPRADAHEGPDARHRARHQPGDGDDGRLRRSSRSARTPTAASTSTTCAPRPTSKSPA